MEALVDLVRAARAGELEEPVVVLASAERARPVPGRERGRLVEEEELRELPRLHQRLAVPALELEPTDDPPSGGHPAPDSPLVVVNAAAVPVDEPAGRIGDQFAERSDAILQRHRLDITSECADDRLPRLPSRPARRRGRHARTIDPRGFPQLSEVWFLHDEGEVKLSLNTARLKTMNMQARPECSLFILDLANPYRYLEVRGRARIEPDDDYAFADKVGRQVRRYRPEDDRQAGRVARRGHDRAGQRLAREHARLTAQGRRPGGRRRSRILFRRFW